MLKLVATPDEKLFVNLALENKSLATPGISQQSVPKLIQLHLDVTL